MNFEIIGDINEVETIAVGRAIRELSQLQERFGRGRWRKLKGTATVQLFNGTIRLVEIHWYEAHGIGKRRLKSSVFWINLMSKKSEKLQFAICVNNEGYEDDLKLRMVYRILPDESAARSNYVRIVDETGEDYLYPAAYFVMIDVPQDAESALLRVA